MMKIDLLSAKREKRLISSPWSLERSMIIVMYVLAIYLRGTLFNVRTLDYNLNLSKWYNFIQSHGGFAALKYNFSNYNVSSLYLLTIATYVPLPKIISVKLIAVWFDMLTALFIYLIVRLKYEKSYLPIIAALVTLFTPTVFINSAPWGQFDSIYASLSLGGLYFLLRKQPFWAFVLFGLAVSFKPQAIFLFPLLFVLLITGEIRKKYFLIIPVVYLITMLPACLIGRGFIDLLTTWADNVGHDLILNAPNIFRWLPSTPYYSWQRAGIILALAAVVILSFVVLVSRRKVTNDIMLKLALVFVLVVPFLLPEMDEKYFYLANVISIIYAFYFPNYFYVAILIEISSLLSYAPYLRNDSVIDLKYLALLMLGVIVMTTLDLVKTLFSAHDVTLGETQALPQDPERKEILLKEIS